MQGLSVKPRRGPSEPMIKIPVRSFNLLYDTAEKYARAVEAGVIRE
jgi:hypothetical protein